MLSGSENAEVINYEPSTSSPELVEGSASRNCSFSPRSEQHGCDKESSDTQNVDDGVEDESKLTTTEAANLSPMEQVLTSEDIVPFIMEELESMYEDDEDSMSDEESTQSHSGESVEGRVPSGSETGQQEGGGEGDFVSLLLVNRSFFEAGANILWKKMSSVTPVFDLLPWYTEPYRGLGPSKYHGAADWERFRLYAHRVRHFDLRATPAFNNSGPWLMELFTLHGRPDPMFPNLQTISIHPESYTTLPLLFFVMSPSIKSLDISICDLPDDLAVLPKCWMEPVSMAPTRWSKPAEETPDGVLAILPRVSVISPCLTTFCYVGPTSEDFFYRLASLQTITTLQLTITNRTHRRNLEHIKTLPLLEDLDITALLPFVFIKAASGDGSTEKDLTWPNLKRLRFTGTDSQIQALDYWIRPGPNLDKLRFHFTRMSKPRTFYYALSSCLLDNPGLETIYMYNEVQAGRKLEYKSQDYAWTAKRSDEELEQLARHALSACAHAKVAVFLDVPPILWSSLSGILQESVANWSWLTNLVFRLQAGVGDEADHIPENSDFPGLAFLAATIWPHCVNLEQLEFHFNKDRITGGELTELLETYDTKTISQGDPEGHPLRYLTINTSAQTEDTLGVDFKTKVQLAVFIDRLFPNLEVLSGTDSATWSDVSALVVSYQDLRKDVESRFGVVED